MPRHGRKILLKLLNISIVTNEHDLQRLTLTLDGRVELFELGRKLLTRTTPATRKVQC